MINPDYRAVFRPMEEEDLPQVMRLEKLGHIAPWTEGIFRDCLRVKYVCVVMEEQHEIVAYAIMSAAFGEAHIFNICVDPKRRRQGIARSMMEYLLEAAHVKKTNTVFLEVRSSNQAAIRLYLDLGFAEVGLRKNYYPALNNRREDAIIMAREITS